MSRYPLKPRDIKLWLDELIQRDVPLTVDIETFALRHNKAGIATIGLAWSEEDGISFPVDMSVDPAEVRHYLKEFFTEFENKTIYHKANFDVYVLVYQLFMEKLVDMKGMLLGLDTMLKNFEDTLYIAYLSLNSCVRPALDLKDLSHDFMGDYAKDIKRKLTDITQIPLPDLLTYNRDDVRATWYVFNKYYPIMVADQQEEIYNTIYKPSMKNIIQMQLTGLPINVEQTNKLESVLVPQRQKVLSKIQDHPIAKSISNSTALTNYDKYRENTPNGKKTIENFEEPFNPNSDLQLPKALFDSKYFGFPVMGKTKSGSPSASSDIIESLLAIEQNENKKEFLTDLLNLKSCEKIFTTYLPAMLQAPDTGLGYSLLFGFFNANGTLSGRLSSSDTNLQNIPASGTVWGKPVKECFRLPEGKLLVGIDFEALEDKISALLTKDPNKLKIYSDGYDGHSLRAHRYFGDFMENIDPDSVESINSIAQRYPQLRTKSKAPTFLLTYDGTHWGLVSKCGLSKEDALMIEREYHELYKVSDMYVQDRVRQASNDGYITVAFGLRLRTPYLAKCMFGGNSMPYRAQKEAKTAGNAIGQSWGLLNVRAANEFMDKVRASQYRYMISIGAQIHDAQYYITDNNVDLLMYMNEHLIKAVQWQEDPQIAHDVVKLSGKMAIYYPSWANETIVENNISRQEMEQICQNLKKQNT